MKVIFLDRDGIINEDIGYLFKVEDFNFMEGIFNSCKYLQSKGFQLIIITNQSGIGRKYYNEKDFHLINNWMLEKFTEQNINILEVLYCPHKPEDNCSCRKPKTGMFDKIHKKYIVNKEDSWMIGDKETDIKAAINFGLTNTIIIENGRKIDKKNSEAKFILSSIKELNKIIL